VASARVYSTNYRDTLILVSSDCPVISGIAPGKAGTIAALQFGLLAASPYALTSDDLLLAVAGHREGMALEHMAELRLAMFAKPQACLRTSPLVKTHGWGLHHDAAGKIALIGRETERYRELLGNPGIGKVNGMRSRRA